MTHKEYLLLKSPLNQVLFLKIVMRANIVKAPGPVPKMVRANGCGLLPGFKGKS